LQSIESIRALRPRFGALRASVRRSASAVAPRVKTPDRPNDRARACCYDVTTLGINPTERANRIEALGRAGSDRIDGVFFLRTCKQCANRLNRPKNPRAEALFDSAEEEIFFCTRDAMDTRA